MSYNPVYEASKALPVEKIAKQLEDFAAAGQDLSRRRFSRSPPPVSSVPSTTFEESNPPSPGEQLRDKESRESGNSEADEQFAIQITDEMERIRAARDMGLLQQPILSDCREAAETNVRYRWICQGIWDYRWDNRHGKIWKHELQYFRPPAAPSKYAKDTESRRLGTKKQREYSDLEEEYQDNVKSAVDFQNWQSSRPCYQFAHQFCDERQWIKLGLSKHDQDQHANLDTRAYNDLKSRWIRDGIWDDDWTLIPGVWWKHERPMKNLHPQGLFRESEAIKAARMEKAERPPDWYFMAPEKPLKIFRPEDIPPFEDISGPYGPYGRRIFESSPEITPPRRDQSVTSRISNEVGNSRSTRQSTVKAQPNAVGQEHHKRPTRSPAKKSIVNNTTTKRNGKPPRKQKIQTPQSRTAKPRPPRERTSAKGETIHPLIQETKNQIHNDTRFPRPRRVAALEAMKKLTRAT